MIVGDGCFFKYSEVLSGRNDFGGITSKAACISTMVGVGELGGLYVGDAHEIFDGIEDWETKSNESSVTATAIFSGVEEFGDFKGGSIIGDDGDCWLPTVGNFVRGGILIDKDIFEMGDEDETFF